MPRNETIHIELEVPQGIEDICKAEVQEKISDYQAMLLHDGAITFDYTGNLSALNSLKSITAAYIVLKFEVPRPKALLGHEHFTKIIRAIESVTHAGGFQSLNINAAGSDSSVMNRLKQEINQATGLQVQEVGDLLIRIRKQNHQWQVLIRTTPRPLATREWRIYDMPGALNGSIAYAMNTLLPKDVSCVNFMCGSGTLMIEACNPQHYLCGLDNDHEALEFAKGNLSAAGITTPIVYTDATQSPFADASLGAISADLPFGQLKGSHRLNQVLYPAVLKEMWRVLSNDGLTVLLTHEARLMNQLLKTMDWHIEQIRTVSLRGIHPRIYVLRKRQRGL
jgi:tRNA (guanine6-N2)-methyltransferase